MSNNDNSNDGKQNISFTLDPVFAENLFFLATLMKTPQAMPQLLEVLLALRENAPSTNGGNKNQTH